MTENSHDTDTLLKLFDQNAFWGQIAQDFWVFAEAFKGMTDGYFIDIGAHNGVHLSNTYALETFFGWKGLLIEANPNSYSELVKNRKQKCLNICLDNDENEVEFAVRGVMGGIVGDDLDNKEAGPDVEKIRLSTRPLIDVLVEQNAPREIDYLSIDVEGAEDRILLNFDFNAYRFNCITIERPSQELRQTLGRNGYKEAKNTYSLDIMYVHESFLRRYRDNLLGFYQLVRNHKMRRVGT